MKNELRDANDQSRHTTIAKRIGEEKIIQVARAKSFKDITSGERKREASKPIFLVRYE